MSSVREFTTPNRLARFVSATDGVTPAEAVAKAEENLAEIRPPGVAHIDRLLADLGARPPQAPDAGEIARLYRIAKEIAGLSGVFALPALGRGAYSLCELLDNFSETGWSAAAVTVHVDGLKLLRQEDSGALAPEAIVAVLAGLEQVAARFAPPGAR